MFPYYEQGVWCFDAWAEYYNLPFHNDLDNIVITQWLYAHTTFGDKGVKPINLDWNNIAVKYKEYVKKSNAQYHRKQALRKIFVAWRHSTTWFKKSKVRDTGRICAQIAAARARGSDEDEIFLSLI